MAYDVDAAPHGHDCVCAACCGEDHGGHDAAKATEGDNAGAAAARGGAASIYAAPLSEDGAGLISGRKWAEATLTYSFPTTALAYDKNPAAPGVQSGFGEAATGFDAFAAAQIVAAEFAFAQYAAVSGLTFVRLDGAEAGDATLRLAESALPPTAWGYYPSASAEGGDAWFGANSGWYDNPRMGGYAWHTILHEIGHTLGLKHGHDQTGYGGLPFGEDTMEQSVMTYRSYIGDAPGGGYANEYGGYAQTLMQADIAAIQQLYGANYDHRAGDTTYSWNPTTGESEIDGIGQGAPLQNRIFMTVWDGGGTDTFDFSNYLSGVSVDLSPGAGAVTSRAQLAELNANEFDGAAAIHASKNVYLARLHEGDPRALIENAIGGRGDDEVIGNQAANRLDGGAGGDRLWGGAGGDTLLGGVGADHLDGGEGRDKLIGGRWADDLDGGAGRDTLKGGGGADILEGGAGRDRLIGGKGEDRFVFSPGDGVDKIVRFRPGADVIDLTAFNAGFEDVAIAATGYGARAEVDDVEIRFLGVAAASIDADDFLF